MGKHYDIEFKNTILNEYLSGKGGSKYLGKKYNIPVIVTEHSSGFMKYFEGKDEKYSKYKSIGYACSI